MGSRSIGSEPGVSGLVPFASAMLVGDAPNLNIVTPNMELERLRMAIEAAGTLIVVLDQRARILAANSGTSAVLDMEEQALIGLDFVETFVPRPKREEYRGRLQRIFTLGFDEAPVHEEALITANTEERMVEFRYRVQNEGNSEHLTMLCVGSDVTEAKRLNSEFLEQAERFRRMFFDSAIGMVLFNLNGYFELVNEEFSKIVGYDENALGNMTAEELTYPDDIAEDQRRQGQLLHGEITSYQIEKRYLHRSGNIVWVQVVVSQLLSDEGLPRFLIAQVRDITGKKLAEQYLERQRMRAEALAALSAALAQVLTDYGKVLNEICFRVGDVLDGLAVIYEVEKDEASFRVSAAAHPHNTEVIALLHDYTALNRSGDGGVIARAIREQRTVYIKNGSRELSDSMIPTTTREYLARVGIDSVVIVPLKAQKSILGVLLVARDRGAPIFGEEDVAFIETVADRAALTITNARLYAANCEHVEQLESRVRERTHELEEANHALEILATTDPLTGAKNRRSFMQCFKEENLRAIRYAHELVVILLDIDHFKKVNDTFGHAAGDRALTSTTAKIIETIRVSDTLGRLGGEEFAVIFPETSLKGGIIAAERIRRAIESTPVAIDDKVFHVTVSIGVTNCIEGDTSETVLARTDVALYRAKEGGRNRVEVETKCP